MLDIVNAYRGLWTKLLAIDNVYTVPFPGSEERVGAQKWHRDPEDLHVVKVYLYFSDVYDEAGPFEYIQGSAKGGPYGDVWPWTVRGGTYPPAGELESTGPERAEPDRYRSVRRRVQLRSREPVMPPVERHGPAVPQLAHQRHTLLECCEPLARRRGRNADASELIL